MESLLLCFQYNCSAQELYHFAIVLIEASLLRLDHINELSLTRSVFFMKSQTVATQNLHNYPVLPR